MWASGGIPPQRYAPASSARLHAQWRSTNGEQREATAVRREWMRTIGMTDDEIDEHFKKHVDLDLADELEELVSAIMEKKHETGQS